MLKKIKSFFISIFNKLYKIAKKFIKEAIGEITQIIIAQLKDIAIKVVEELENTDLTNSEKREEAFKRIKQYAIDKGISTKSSVIYLVIELAVQYIKTAE